MFLKVRGSQIYKNTVGKIRTWTASDDVVFLKLPPMAYNYDTFYCATLCLVEYECYGAVSCPFVHQSVGHKTPDFYQNG